MSRTKRVKDARKTKYTADQIKAIVYELEQYIDANEFPKLSSFIILPEIRHKYKLTTQYIYDHPEYFSYLTDIMTAKCEDYLTKKALSGHASVPAMFLLKQSKYGGLTDRQDIDLTAKTQPIKFINTVPRPKKSPKK